MICRMICRDGQKTQYGIETSIGRRNLGMGRVATARKPSTGLKPETPDLEEIEAPGRDGQKTQYGIETF